MINSHKLFVGVATLSFAVQVIRAQSSEVPLVCSIVTSVTPMMRAEGLTEWTGDIVLTCMGGPALTPGTQIPQVNMSVWLNTAITSRLLGASTAGSPAGLSEALLMIDDPGSISMVSAVPNFGPSAPQILCTTPATGCVEYVGTAGGIEVPVLNSSNSVPAIQDAPNVFQGVVSGNQVVFYGVPILPPGTGGRRVFRIANIRANAAAVSVDPILGFGPVTASVAGSGAISLPIANPVQTVGFVRRFLNFGVVGAAGFPPCSSGSLCPYAMLQFRENGARAFLTRVRPLANSPYAGQAQNLAGQDIPGFVLSSESGFIASYVTGANGAPAGLSDYGTRLKAVITNIPPGVSVYVALYNALPPDVPGGDSYVSFAALVTDETASDGSGVVPTIPGTATYGLLPVAKLPVVNGSAMAVWEVLNTNLVTPQSFDFPLLVSYSGIPTPSGSLGISGSLAPNPDQGAFPAAAGAAASSTLPVPRFAPSLSQDGTVTPAGGTVQDSVFGARASITFPSGAVSGSTTVAIDVLPSPPQGVPLPSGFSAAGTYFVSIQLNPEPAFPLPPPGLTVVLPLATPMSPGAALYLYRMNPMTGLLEPSLNTSANPVVGYVDATGDSATFSGISRLSTVVGLQSLPIELRIDVKPGDTGNPVNLKAHGTLPVLIYGTSTLDGSKIDVSSLRLSGAGISRNAPGKYQAALVDYNADGWKDLMVHFDIDSLQLTPDTKSLRLDGKTLDYRLIWGQDSVRIVH